MLSHWRPTFSLGSTTSWWFRLTALVFAIGTSAVLISCDGGGSAAPVAEPTGKPAGVDTNVSTPAPTPAMVVELTVPSRGEPEEEGTPASVAPSLAVARDEPLVLPRHGGPLLVNRGDSYVYGELWRLGDCLRVSYVDQADRVGTRDGLLVVWPAGFEARVQDGLVEVFDPDGFAVAAVGQTLRMSGRRVSEVGEWDWGEADGRCPGPYWLVGDEVTAVAGDTSGLESYNGVLFARSGEQSGPIVSPLAGLGGRLGVQSRCLVVEDPHYQEAYLVIWPPGFRVERSGADVTVVNGGGNVIAVVGEEVLLGGSYNTSWNPYSGECEGPYFKAYSVQRVDSGLSGLDEHAK